MPATRLRQTSVRRADDFGPSEDPSACKIVVLYEDTPSRTKAMVLCERLTQQFWQQVQFDIGWWKFRYLMDAQIAETAGRAATEADLLVFAAESRDELPPIVRNWMEKWIVRRPSREGALVALVAQSSGASAPPVVLYSYLRTIAQRAHMDFLASPGWDMVVTDPSTTTATEILEAEPQRLPDKNPALPKPSSHWGINE